MQPQQLEEIKYILLNCDTTKCKIKLGDDSYLFTKDKKDGYWINRRENREYGLVITSDGTVVWGYPHLINIKDSTELKLNKYILELKLNGTNVIVSKYNDKIIMRTRMSLNSEFPVPTFWNNNINGIQDKEIQKRLLDMRNEMICKYPQYYIFEAYGEYVGLKYQKVIEDILPIKIITDTYSKYVFYFELFGKLNPIVIDDKFIYGVYIEDYDIVLFDIFDKESQTFLHRYLKEGIADTLKLKLVPVLYNFSNVDDLRKAIPHLKEEADRNLIEGMVLKPISDTIYGEDIIKVKGEIVLNSARRLEAVLKGFIMLNDLYNYISKVVSSESLKAPEKFNEIVELVGMEAVADNYSEEIVAKNKKDIQKRIAYQMAVLVADQIIKEHKFETSDELYRFINLELPKRFEPLRDYIDYELEKSTEDKKLKEKMKRRRVELFSKVAKYCMKTLGIDRGKYETNREEIVK